MIKQFTTQQAPLGPVMLGISSTVLLPHEITWLSHKAVGGVILFTRNFTDIAQLRALTKQIKTHAPHILIAVDQEGGRVQRFETGFTKLPALTNIGQQYDENTQVGLALAQKAGYTMASELLACGIDMSFAPVIDCAHSDSNVLVGRTFHQDPHIIVHLARAYIAGMRKAGMFAVAKHFPGHGGVQADSHKQLPVDNRDLDTLLQKDLLPFKMLVNECEAMMAAHILYPSIDPKFPVGYSPYWLQTILQDRLGFKGIIFSDDLDMAAATVISDVVTRVTQALIAGCHMVLLCNDPVSIEAVLTAFSKGRITVPENAT